MNKSFKLLFMIGVILAILTVPGFASNWVAMEEKAGAVHQIDMETLQFSGEDADKQVEVWMKSLPKDGTGSYYIAHYLVKENGLTFILKDRTFYSVNGVVLNSFQNNTDKWNPTTPSTPIGSVAIRLFAEYHKNPEAFNPKQLTNSFDGQRALSAEIKIKETAEPLVEPNEVKKALDEEQIKKGRNADGADSFYVRDRRGPALFSGISHFVTTDFYLTIGANANRTATLQFSTEDTRAGVHKEKGKLTIQIDGKDWVLASPLYSDTFGSSSAKYMYSYKLPDTLIQAIAVTKNPVTIKWMHSYNNSWEDRERTIPDKTLRAIQLMYLGCK